MEYRLLTSPRGRCRQGLRRTTARKGQTAPFAQRRSSGSRYKPSPRAQRSRCLLLPPCGPPAVGPMCVQDVCRAAPAGQGRRRASLADAVQPAQRSNRGRVRAPARAGVGPLASTYWTRTTQPPPPAAHPRRVAPTGGTTGRAARGGVSIFASLARRRDRKATEPIGGLADASHGAHQGE
jgi:hypothetical protein